MWRSLPCLPLLWGMYLLWLYVTPHCSRHPLIPPVLTKKCHGDRGAGSPCTAPTNSPLLDAVCVPHPVWVLPPPCWAGAVVLWGQAWRCQTLLCSRPSVTSFGASFLLLLKVTPPLFRKTPVPWLLLNPADGHLPLQQDQFGQMSPQTVSLTYAVDTHIPVLPGHFSRGDPQEQSHTQHFPANKYL